MPQFKYPQVGTNADDTLPFFVSFELFAIVTFTIEYCLRLFTAHSVDYIDLGYKQFDIMIIINLKIKINVVVVFVIFVMNHYIKRGYLFVNHSMLLIYWLFYHFMYPLHQNKIQILQNFHLSES